MRPKRRILLVDTNEVMLSVRGFMLGSKSRYDVTRANEAELALALLGQASPTFDAVVCELALAGRVNGNRLAQLVKQLRPGMPVLLLSHVLKKIPGGEACWADVWLPRGLHGALEVLAELQRLTIRKRGPKPAPRPAEMRGAA